VGHRRCNRRREGGRSLGFERSGSEENPRLWLPCWREACRQILDCFVLRYWYIYIGVSLRIPREGVYIGAGGLTAWGVQSDCPRVAVARKP
jgi:hypothetical protein